MDWEEAESRIRAGVTVGVDLNTVRSTCRRVLAADVPIDSRAYGYHNEHGFIVSIGRSSSAKIRIPWSMLKECFGALAAADGYSGAFFRTKYPKQACIHGCHVHVVGQIFVKAGIAVLDEADTYWLAAWPM